MSDDATSQFRSDVVSGTMGLVTAYVIGILSLPLITYYYQPEHIGSWQILLAGINLLIPLATLQLDKAIVLEGSRKITSWLLTAIVINTAIICILLLVAGLLFGDRIIRLLDLRGAEDIVLIGLTGLILQVALLSMNALIIKQKKFRRQAISKISGALTIPVLAVSALIFFEASSVTFIIASMSGILVQVALLYKSVDVKGFSRVRHLSAQKMVAAVKKYRVYPTYMVPYNLSQAGVWQITLVTFGMFFSTGVVGAYTVARQIVHMPVSLLSFGLKQAVFSYAAAAPKYDEGINNHIRGLLINIVNLAVPSAVFGFFHLPAFIDLVLGEGWENVGVFSRWMLLSAAMLMLTSWLDRIFDVYSRQRLAVFLQISSDLLFLLVLAVCCFMEVGVLVTIICLSVFLVVYNLLWLYIVLDILAFAKAFWFHVVARMALLAVIFLVIMKFLEAMLPFWIALSAEILLLSCLGYFVYKTDRASHA